MRGSLIGVALRVQREAWTAATASGVPTSTLKVIALAGGAAIASLAGWFFATVNGFVLPDSFSTSIVFLVVFMPIFGGTASPWGAVIGAGLVVIFTQAFDFLAGPGMLTFAVLALFVLLVAPSGILGLGRTIGVALGRLIDRHPDARNA
jgi:branched-chain amino acid transport system permease protein